ncbi:WD repeat-containing protein 48 homolog isoform X2 [Aphidius gifuensis]|uniref:WD repeat-containing protein 48 homolog isoform X2 n=1 Tax=Aphidius gifuensis TaxID=684658 RepID=UPI001CDB96D5|nr:WD repeat-containing protein 48 homolog isoform X2 [Aphidius gifuensis]
MGKKRGVHETTPELRNRMVGMYEAGLGLRDIAAAVNCSQRTVKRWLNRFDREGTVETRERCGRKRATTSEQDEAIIQLATQTPITAAKTVLPALGLSCSVDTVRERLHKAGIHNWSPSKKHIQRIPIGDADSKTIQKSVWRPTGTQLGKKKFKKINDKLNKLNKQTVKKKKKIILIKNKKTIQNEKANEDVNNETNERATSIQTQLPYENYNITIVDDSERSIIQNNNQIQYSNTLELAESSIPLYENHSQINTSQNWPLDLVQSSNNNNDYANNQQTCDSSVPQLHELYPASRNQVDDVHNQHVHQQIQEHQQPIDNTNQNSNSSRDNRRELKDNNELTDEDNDEEDCDDDDDDEQEKASSNNKKINSKKKGGKAKGTLETSIEIRNRMIGMSEAGLSTLSIALAINRSERTVKRWLERWKKEGNVQTKERKGRKRITTKEQDDAIIQMATDNPLTAAKLVAPALGLSCSVDTIRERLHKAGIHSWKLGKKQGEGNAVHTVHLWQPSGNRSSKTKQIIEKKKKIAKKKNEITSKILSSTSTTKKYTSKKKNITSLANDTSTVPCDENIIQFNNSETANYSEDVNLQQRVDIPVATGLVISSIPPSIPIMIPRSDCRMTTTVPSANLISSQPTSTIAYSSCMISNTGGTHQNNIDHHQTDQLNYEPYMWNYQMEFSNV